MIDPPAHEFETTSADPRSHTLVVTAELQAWAAAAAEELRADGWPAPPDLDRLRAGQTIARAHWPWLLHYLRSPRPPCPF
jgi:hypothetical protein